MSEEFFIVIADRNRHVREFLRRELMGEGYRVRAVKDGREVLLMIEEGNLPDLLILDLEIPYVSGVDILERLRHRQPPLPVVIHTFLTEYSDTPAVDRSAAFVEKSGNTDRLKAAVMEMLKRFYPHRFSVDTKHRPLQPESD